MAADKKTNNVDAFNKAFEFIRKNLNNELDLLSISAAAKIPETHFQYICKAYYGKTIGSLIPNIRMDVVANKLKYTDFTITRIAEICGYSSQNALVSDFQNKHDVSPTEYRIKHQYKPLVFDLKKMKNIELNPKIEKMETQFMLFSKIEGKNDIGELFEKCWSKLFKFIKEEELTILKDEYYGIRLEYSDINNESFSRYYACVPIKKLIAFRDEDFGTLKMKSGRFAIFNQKSSRLSIAPLYDAIYRQWLPENDLILRNAHCIEKYLTKPKKADDMENVEDVYVPVQVKI